MIVEVSFRISSPVWFGGLRKRVASVAAYRIDAEGKERKAVGGGCAIEIIGK
jgi:hypothetical protein